MYATESSAKSNLQAAECFSPSLSPFVRRFRLIPLARLPLRVSSAHRRRVPAYAAAEPLFSSEVI